jgi:23S rRNA pseudouridine2605 synthase
MTRKSAKQTEPQRLQKVLAQAGVASRRAGEQMIEAGRVSVNGQVVTRLGVKVDPDRDEIRVDGQPLPKTGEPPLYIILNKPPKILSAAADERGRQTVVDLVDTPARLYPVGRLDWHSEGLILLTNDGDLTRKLTHPGYAIEKEYHVLVRGQPSTQTLAQWRQGGIVVEGRPTAGAGVERLKVEHQNTWLKVILTEGRKRQIREVARAMGHPVITLKRVRIGPIQLGNLKRGQWRHLNPAEVQRLKQAANLSRKNP